MSFPIVFPRVHKEKSAVVESLAVIAGLRRRFATELGVMRASVAPEQHEFFDPFARI